MSDSESDSPIVWETAVVGIIFKDGKVLLGLREREPAKGVWALPGGGLHPGETHHRGLLREIQEELGLYHMAFAHKMPTARIYATHVHGERVRYVQAFHYLLTIISGTPEALDATDAIRWCGEENCKKLYQERLLLEASGEALETTLGWVIRK